MASLNRVDLIGNLCQEPEKKITTQGTPVVSISLATNETYKDKSGQKQQSTEYHRLVFWDKLSDIVSNYCHKGSLIYVSGKLQIRKWKNKDGVDMQTTEINVRELQMLDSKQGEGGQQSPPQQRREPMHNIPPDNQEGGFIEEDIPF